MVALLVISVALLVWGFIAGFEANEGQAVDTLLYWTYAMVGLAVLCCLVLATAVNAINNPKSLIRIGVVLVGIVAVCAVAYLLAAGKPAMGMLVQPEASTLKLTDTVLNLTYFAGAAAIVAIIVGEVRMAIANKKK